LLSLLLLIVSELLGPLTAFPQAVLAWVALLLPLVLELWRAGVRRYSAMEA